ncbi:heterokaryon incompatibility protein-domain-containing protein [Leptodontidium sp. 2 PMI_412]|nr:heterokaryon incompatibility protein-domain-containing protein [Leptodontidium sp. 2 PMI_412]
MKRQTKKSPKQSSQVAALKMASLLYQGVSLPKGKKENHHIRLATLLPSQWRHPLQCLLQVVSFEPKPSYEALSYVWGNPNRKKTIYVNETPFPITQNLYAALKHLRKRDSPRYLWIDAICINQQDDLEKTQQVSLMSTIFSKCDRALLWIDLEPEAREASSKSWLRASHHSLVFLFESDRHFHRLPCFRVNEEDGQSAGLSEIFIQCLEMLEMITNCQWWNRIWIVQETVLPPTTSGIPGLNSRVTQRYADSGSARIAFWKTITGDLTQEDTTTAIQSGRELEHFRRADPHALDGFENLMLTCFPEEDNDELSAELTEETELAARFLLPMMFSSCGRRLFVTETGYIGAGPRNMQIGDQVFVLLGGEVPFVMREVEAVDTDKLYRLVGDCYVHGIMDGEAVNNESAGSEARGKQIAIA